MGVRGMVAGRRGAPARPLGAYTVATLTLARTWHLAALEWAGAGLFVLLALFWLLVATRTLGAAWTGEAWRAAPASPATGSPAGGDPA